MNQIQQMILDSESVHDSAVGPVDDLAGGFLEDSLEAGQQD